MTTGNIILSTALVTALVVGVLGILLATWSRRRKVAEPQVHASIERMRAIGQLSVFKVITKEIVTETDHSWGEFGQKYLSWVMSGKKMAMIFEFEIDFRYDLRRPEFEVLERPGRAFLVRVPPCFFEAHIRDIRFYDEQRARVLPWLLPDLLNGFLAGGFSEADKNKLVVAAKGHAEKQAVALIESLQSEVQNSAQSTLLALSRAFGAEQVEFEFLPQGAIRLQIGLAGTLAA
jgi:hypothetical protein